MILDRLRLGRVLLRSLLDPRQPGETVRRLPRRVRLVDCDLNLHMNNARYLTIMDFGRWDLTVRLGLLREALRSKVKPVVVDLEIRFRQELRPGQAYVLETAVARLEGRKLWFSQRFLVGDRVCAEASVGVLFLKAGRVIGREPVEELLAGLGLDTEALRQAGRPPAA